MDSEFLVVESMSHSSPSVSPVSGDTQRRSPPVNAARAVADPAAKAPPREAIIGLHQVTKAYPGGSLALDGVDLSVGRGDFIFITGPSGSGKSTLLKLLYGEERANAGTITVDGYAVGELRGDRLAELRRRIGIVFQDYKLIPRRTVAENVAFSLWAQGLRRAEIQRRLGPALKMVGLPHKANSFPDELSGGEQQRVSIARAIVGTPPILLADEPTGNLDGNNSLQVIKILQKLNGIGITVIVTTHDEALLRHFAYPVVRLVNGKLFVPQSYAQPGSTDRRDRDKTSPQTRV